MATTLPLTYVRGYCLHCGGYDLHIQGCYCRKCWVKIIDAQAQPPVTPRPPKYGKYSRSRKEQ